MLEFRYKSLVRFKIAIEYTIYTLNAIAKENGINVKDQD